MQDTQVVLKTIRFRIHNDTNARLKREADNYEIKGTRIVRGARVWVDTEEGNEWVKGFGKSTSFTSKERTEIEVTNMDHFPEGCSCNDAINEYLNRKVKPRKTPQIHISEDDLAEMTKRPLVRPFLSINQKEG